MANKLTIGFMDPVVKYDFLTVPELAVELKI
jgi:hypothetical protein